MMTIPNSSKHLAPLTDLARSGKPILLTAAGWGGAGAVGVPLLINVLGLTFDQASAVLVVYLGVGTLTLRVVMASIRFVLRRSKPPSEADIQGEVSGRTLTLVSLVLLGLGLALLTVVSAGSFWVFNTIQFHWIVETAWKLTQLSAVSAVGCLLSVPLIIAAYAFVEQLDEFALLFSKKFARVSMIATVLIASQLTTNHHSTHLMRHITSLARHA